MLSIPVSSGIAWEICYVLSQDLSSSIPSFAAAHRLMYTLKYQTINRSRHTFPSADAMTETVTPGRDLLILCFTEVEEESIEV